MTTSPISLSDLFTMQNLGINPPPQFAANGMGMPVSQMPAQTPMAGPQNVQMPPDISHIQNVVNQYQQNQGGQDSNGFLQQILSNRLQPDLGDASKSAFMSNQTGQYVSPNQVMANRITTQLSPYSEAVGLQGKMAEAGLQNAQAAYYQSALQRDLASKAYEYANDPARMQALMMARYMQGLSGGGLATPNTPQTIVQDVAGTPAGSQLPSVPLNQAMAANSSPMPSGGGFNPMGAMLAKSLGLTDMQIGANGQPMPIPGSMKIENGSVISFDQNGKPQSNIPVNPRAQGLFEQKLQDMNNKLDQLHALGGTVEEGGLGNLYNNKAVQLSASKSSLFGFGPGGQDFMQGTPEQTLRDGIQADVKQALPLYMQAFGITPGMERAASAQQMLLDAIGGDVTKSRQHLKSNLANLSQTAGTGQLYSQLNQPQTPTARVAPVTNWIIQGGKLVPSGGQ